jgi:phosphopantothenoylcysteine decarboxylase/phosphopantothenate--cysteine ligase
VSKILLGVTGSIAAYKACELTRLLVKAGHEVVPLVTPGAERFVTRETFVALARRPADEDAYPHLERADLLVVAPLSANTLAKLAYGIADTLVTEAALAHTGPVLVAPAMNHRMWSNAATQENVATLLARGVDMIGPEEGELAEGETGRGRMSEPTALAARVEELLARAGSLAGRRVLVSAGGTREPLDAVRFVGNRSSGRMGVELAAEARRRGAEVTLVAANLAVPAPGGVEVVQAPTAAELEAAILERAATADILVMAAAVADYRPAETIAAKRPKDGERWTVALEPTTDVLRAVAAALPRNGQVRVAFGAELGAGGLERKRRMLAEKDVDLVVFNDVSRADIGFESGENEVVLVTAAGERSVERAPKRVVAGAVLDEAARLLAER